MAIAEVARHMLDTYPRESHLDRQLLVRCIEACYDRCIEACYDCSEACTQCADDCLSEQDLQELAKCIRLNLDCADVCQTTGRVVSRQTEYDANVTRALLGACIAACRGCGDECKHHGDHGMEHCKVCAEECRRCEQACEALVGAIS